MYQNIFSTTSPPTPEEEFLQTGSPGLLTSSISALLSSSERSELSKITSPCTETSNYTPSTLSYINEVQNLIPTFNPSILEYLGAPRSTPPSRISSPLDSSFDNENHPSFNRTRFFTKLGTSTTVTQYAQIFSHFLHFLQTIFSPATTTSSDISSTLLTKITQSTPLPLQTSILEFFSSQELPISPKNIGSFIFNLLGTPYDHSSSPLSIPFILFTIGKLSNEETGALIHSERANKCISALKFISRGSALILYNSSLDLSHLRYSIGSTNAYSNLFRFSKTLQSFHRPLLHPIVFTQNENTISISASGHDFSPVKLSNILATLYTDMINILSSELLLNIASYNEISATFQLHLQKPQNPNPIHAGNGLNLENSPHYDTLLYTHARTTQNFHFPNGALKNSKVTKFVKSCENFEKKALPFLHILLGGSPRASDYSHLFFRNTSTSLANIQLIHDAKFLFLSLPSQKTTLLRNSLVRVPRFLPTHCILPLLIYWSIVRPCAAQLICQDSSFSDSTATNWASRAFIFDQKNVSAKVRSAISAVFHANSSASASSTAKPIFQLLRHAMVCLFRRIIRDADETPDLIFGHSAQTGRLYGRSIDLAGPGVRAGQPSYLDGSVDASDTLFTYKRYWKILNLDFENSVSGQLSTPNIDSDSDFSGLDGQGSSNNDENPTTPTENIQFEGQYCPAQLDQNVAAGEYSHSNIDANIDFFAASQQSMFDNVENNNVVTEIVQAQAAERLPQLVAESAAGEHNSANFDSDSDFLNLHRQSMFDNVGNQLVSTEITQSDAAEAEIENFAPLENFENFVAAPHFSVLNALQMLNYTQFKSNEQQQLVEFVWDLPAQSPSLLAVLPTSAGKSLSFFIWTCSPINQVIIVVVPFKALLDDFKNRITAFMREKIIFYDTNLNFCEISSRVRLIFVQAELTHDSGFQNILSDLESCGRLRLIIFDECHTLLQAVDYRQLFRQLPTIIRSLVRCPFLLLSATVPPIFQPELLEHFSTPQPRILRTKTTRDDLFYEVIRTQNYRNFIENMLISRLSEHNNNKMIIILGSKEMANEWLTYFQPIVPQTTGLGLVTADTLQNLEILKKFKNGQIKILLGTIILLHGIDVEGVDRVIIVNPNTVNLSYLVQAAGRCARNNEVEGVCTLLSNSAPISDSLMQEYLTISSCRRNYLLQQIDGIFTSQNCQNCDNCSLDSASSLSFSATSASSSVITLPSISPSNHSLSSSDHSLALTHLNSTKTKLELILAKIQKCCHHFFCFICYAKNGAKVQHTLHSCPLFRFRCFGCAQRNSGHFLADCPVRKIFFEMAIQQGICFRCFFPPSFSGISLGQMGKNCPRADCIIPLILLDHSPSILSKFDKIIDIIYNYVI